MTYDNITTYVEDGNRGDGDLPDAPFFRGCLFVIALLVALLACCYLFFKE